MLGGYAPRAVVLGSGFLIVEVVFFGSFKEGAGVPNRSFLSGHELRGRFFVTRLSFSRLLFLWGVIP